MKVSLRVTILTAIAAAALLCCGGKDTGSAPSPITAEFTDTRDGKVYKIVSIGSQIWMAENLNYDIPDDTSDVCYENSAENCAKYGRLYTWDAASVACPDGYHLPSNDEWDTLDDYVGGDVTTKLKSASGWKRYKLKSGNGTDEYGFSALPGGYYDSGDGFKHAGGSGDWWSATNYISRTILPCVYCGPSYMRPGNARKFSVRCVQDAP